MLHFVLVGLVLILTVGHVAPTAPQVDEFDWDSRLGVVVFLQGRAFFVTQNAKVPQRPLILFVGENGTDLRWIRGAVHKLERAGSAEPLVLIDGESSVLYRLDVGDAIGSSFELGFGILAEAPDSGGDTAPTELDLDDDGAQEFFYQCKSREGEHMIVRTGDRLSGETRWRAYYYLGYEAEPNCREEDYS